MASYDKKPSVLEAVGNGSYLYRWGIKKVKDAYECNEVTVWNPLTENGITEAVISHLWDSNYEQKLVNEYNAANLGVYDAEEAEEKVNAYKTFLSERKNVKAQIEKDCKALGIA